MPLHVLLVHFCVDRTHQREGVDGVVHGALAWHCAPVAQQHEKAGQAVEQRSQGRRRLLETQEARERPLRGTKPHDETIRSALSILIMLYVIL